MLELNGSTLMACEKEMESCRLYGENIPIYINKSKSPITKDRVAAAFICDELLNSRIDFSKILIKSVSKSEESEHRFQSNMALTYNSLISFIYYLRLCGDKITSMNSISYGDNKQIISVEDINASTDFIKVSVSDDLRWLVDGVINEQKYKDKDRHLCTIVSLNYKEEQETEFKDAINIALKHTFGKIAEYIIRSNEGDKYIIFEGAKACCVVTKKFLVITHQYRLLDLSKFVAKLRLVCYGSDIEYNININKEIDMI